MAGNEGRHLEIVSNIIGSLRRDDAVTQVVKGVYWTAVVSRWCGLASTMMAERCLDEDGEETALSSPTESTALQLARLALSSEISRASLGMAAINSLIDVDTSRCSDINAGDMLLREGAGRNVSVIGHFPFTEELRKVAGHLWVIEKRQWPGDHPEGDAAEYLPRSDVVAISSTTLINHTLFRLLPLCPKKSLKILLGPTTPLTEVLFDYGIDVVSGSRVVDRERALKYIGEGVNFRQLKRTGAVRLLTMTRQSG